MNAQEIGWTVGILSAAILGVAFGNEPGILLLAAALGWVSYTLAGSGH